MGNYSASQALTWMVKDGQREGTEHKQLTDAMRAFSNEEGEKPVSEWLDEYEKATEDTLKDSTSRKVKPKNANKEKLCKAAAKCIRKAIEDGLAAMKVKQSAKARNSFQAKKAIKEIARKAGNVGA